MTLTGRNIITAEALEGTLDLLDTELNRAQGVTTEARTAINTLNSHAQTFAEAAAAGAAPALVGRVATVEAAAQGAVDAALAVTEAGQNRVATVAALDPAAADGSSAYVESDGLIYRKRDGIWLPRLDLSAARRGMGLSAALYSLAQNDVAVDPRVFKQVRRAIAESRAVRIAFGGDSITEGGDTNPQSTDRWADRWIAALRHSLPGVQIEVQNFGLGSRRLRQMVDPAYVAVANENGNPDSGFYRHDWPGFTLGKSWHDHIRDWNPDLLVIAHGMNDSGDGLAGAKAFKDRLNTLLSDMQGWPSTPDPVLVSGFESTDRPDSVANPAKWVRAYSRVVRAVANRRGVPLADAHRLDRILRDGSDDRLTQTRTMHRWLGLEDQTVWTWNDAASWNVGRGPNGIYDWSTLAPSAADTNYRAVTSRAVARDGYAEAGVVCPDAQTLGWFEILHRPDEDTGLVALVTPNGSANGPARIDWILRATNEVLYSHPINLPVGQFCHIRWLWQNGAHRAEVQINGGATDVVTFECLHALWDGAVRFSSAGAPFRTAEFRNAYVYLYEPLGARRGAALAREQEVMGVWPTNWPTSSGNGMNHVDTAGGAVIYLAAFAPITRALAQVPGLPLERRAALPLLNGWVNFDGLGGYPDAEAVRLGSQVRLCGLVRVPAGVTYPVTVAQLPAGFRPAGGLFRVWVANGVGKDVSGDAAPDDLSIAFGQVNPDGTVVILSGSAEGGFVDLGSCAPLDA